MPDYGEAKYWDNRYLQESSEPFDWLLDYNNVDKIIDSLINKESKILMIGCGNAPFSADMYQNGYPNIINIDISPVVIEQQKERFPEMSWLVMNVHELQFPRESFPVVLDKSLLDTVLCYSNRVRNHRWDEESNSRRNVAHTLIICEKPGIDGSYRPDYSSSLPGVLSENEYNQLEEYSMKVNSNKLIREATTESLLRFLDKALSTTYKTT